MFNSSKMFVAKGDYLLQLFSYPAPLFTAHRLLPLHLTQIQSSFLPLSLSLAGARTRVIASPNEKIATGAAIPVKWKALKWGR